MNSKPMLPSILQRPAWMLLGLILLAGGCAPSYTDFSAFVREPRPVVTASEYRMAPPDEIRIKSKRVREINGHTETIRPDGYITLPLLGSVYVAGRTAEEVNAELASLAREYYEDADVTLYVESFNSKKIYVFGEVALKGAYPYDGANTVLETLAVAQPTRLADANRIQILRPNGDGELIRRMTISLNDMIKRGDTSLDAVLEEGDIIYVPAHPLASVAIALQQILLPLQPAAQTVGAGGTVHSPTQGWPYKSNSSGQ